MLRKFFLFFLFGNILHVDFIKPLMSLVLGNEESTLEPSLYIEPETLDIMLTDLNHAKIINISMTDFGFAYNSVTRDTPSFPIFGFIMTEPYGRNIVPLIIQYKKKKIKTIAISDTGNPFVHISENTMKALGIVDSSHANVLLHGKPAFVYRSTNHFSDVNVLGASFYKLRALTVIANYYKSTVTIQESFTEYYDEL